MVNEGELKIQKEPMHGFEQSLCFRLPPLGVTFFVPKGLVKAKKPAVEESGEIASSALPEASVSESPKKAEKKPKDAKSAGNAKKPASKAASAKTVKKSAAKSPVKAAEGKRTKAKKAEPADKPKTARKPRTKAEQPKAPKEPGEPV